MIVSAVSWKFLYYSIVSNNGRPLVQSECLGRNKYYTYYAFSLSELYYRTNRCDSFIFCFVLHINNTDINIMDCFYNTFQGTQSC